ncbi:rrna processing, partial [Nannochloropsis oceanica]
IISPERERRQNRTRSSVRGNKHWRSATSTKQRYSVTERKSKQERRA